MVFLIMVFATWYFNYGFIFLVSVILYFIYSHIINRGIIFRRYLCGDILSLVYYLEFQAVISHVCPTHKWFYVS